MPEKADGICMIVTGGKDHATVFRENGWNVLADLFQGLSIGLDLASLVFPVGALIKSIVKTGIKAALKLTLTALKETAKKIFKDVFKSGAKNGVKNFGKLLFSAFVVDLDDLKALKSLKVGLPDVTPSAGLLPDEVLLDAAVVDEISLEIIPSTTTLDIEIEVNVLDEGIS